MGKKAVIVIIIIVMIIFIAFSIFMVVWFIRRRRRKPPATSPPPPPDNATGLDATSWTCVPGVNAPVQVNSQSQIQCVSIDGNNCLWQAQCKNLLENLPVHIKPYICTTKQLKDTTHWCYKAYQALQAN